MKRGGILNIEWHFLIPVAILFVFSLSTLFSINIIYFKSQLIYLILGILCFIFFSNINYQLFKFYYLSIYVVSLVLLIIVLILGIESRGAVRWIDILGFRIQFSEILKPFLAVSFSSFLVNLKNTSFRDFLISWGFAFSIAFLVYLQPDLGNALIYLSIAFFTMLVFGFPFKSFFLGVLALALSTPVLWRFLHDYQKQRILTFINPNNDPLGTSYNAIQAVLAVGSGMFFGKGLGEGTQSGLRFLPERHTDFIFASLSEEFGFIGSLIVILCFVFLLYKIYVVFKNSDDKFCRIFSASAFFLILIQVFFNIGMNIGIVPVVGITLPFVSYGGSSVLSNFILVGFLSAISKSLKAKEVLEIR